MSMQSILVLLVLLALITRLSKENKQVGNERAVICGIHFLIPGNVLRIRFAWNILGAFTRHCWVGACFIYLRGTRKVK